VRRGRHAAKVAVAPVIAPVIAPPPWPPRVEREVAPVGVQQLADGEPTAPVTASAPREYPSAVDESVSAALRMLAEVTRLCDRIVDHLEAERTERRVLLETLNGLARSLTAPTVPTPVPAAQPRSLERIVGGSVDAGPAPDLVLDEFEEYKPNVSVKVKCAAGAGEAWVEGFEIVDVVSGPEHLSYQIRRKRDGVVLPTPFAATDLRRVRAAWNRSI
jgi:hypothetical protein